MTDLDQSPGQAVYGVPEIASGNAGHPESQYNVPHSTEKEVCVLALSYWVCV